ncbi:hypothetical protein [Glycomyces tritici]|uniref:Uncharacterized protein n=1 Tax=Glycomyces tritici TaxID=2665176 RepID=A0ABT7YWP9_9ACTN|nr:hypothetical protein [Glycomyces tritici]MDN3243017.1 hypothetical protein [Glycomyces tritici]
MTEDFYPTMDDAVAAVQSTYPNAVREPDIEPMFHSSIVFHDAASHTVCVVGPNEWTDDRTEGCVSHGPGARGRDRRHIHGKLRVDPGVLGRAACLDA